MGDIVRGFLHNKTKIVMKLPLYKREGKRHEKSEIFCNFVLVNYGYTGKENTLYALY